MSKKGTKRTGFRKLNKTKRGGVGSRQSRIRLAHMAAFGASYLANSQETKGKSKTKPPSFYEMFLIFIVFVVASNIYGQNSTFEYTGLRYPRDLSRSTLRDSNMPSLSSRISLKPTDVTALMSKLPDFVVPGVFNIEAEMRKLNIPSEVVTKTARLLPAKLRMVDFDYLVRTKQVDYISKERTLKELMGVLLKLADENPDVKVQFVNATQDVESFLRQMANEDTYKRVDPEKK